MSDPQNPGTQEAADRLVQKTLKSPGVYIKDSQVFVKALSCDLKGTKADLYQFDPWQVAQIGFNYLNTAYCERSDQLSKDLKLHLQNAKPLYLNALLEAAQKENISNLS